MSQVLKVTNRPTKVLGADGKVRKSKAVNNRFENTETSLARSLVAGNLLRNARNTDCPVERKALARIARMLIAMRKG